MEQYIAIDNVCAWPNIKQLPNGDIIAVIFNQPCHLLWEGTIDCWKSSDNGKSWEFLSNPVINEKGTNRGNVAVGFTTQDELLVLCSGWNMAEPAPDSSVQGDINDDRIKYHMARKLPLWPVYSISNDNGKTWQSGDIKVENFETDYWIPYGDILKLDNDCLGCSMYGIECKTENLNDGRKMGNHFFESEDNGKTWKWLAKISDEGNETTLIKLADGKLLAGVRSINIDLYESTDEGKSWQYVCFLTGHQQLPGAFTLLPDKGFLLLTHGIRYKGLYGVGALLMDLETGKWGKPMYLADLKGAWDGGYPSNILLDDGKILTAYYCGPSKNHSRYHMGTIIWDLDEQIMANTCQ